MELGQLSVTSVFIAVLLVCWLIPDSGSHIGIRLSRSLGSPSSVYTSYPRNMVAPISLSQYHRSITAAYMTAGELDTESDGPLTTFDGDVSEEEMKEIIDTYLGPDHAKALNRKVELAMEEDYDFEVSYVSHVPSLPGYLRYAKNTNVLTADMRTNVW
jgi:hypothetical protein